MVNWKAVLYGIVTTVVVGLLSGLGIPFTDAALPLVGHGLTSLIAGGVAGYVAYSGLGQGALHGFLATAIGGLLVVGFLVVVGTITAGLIGLSMSLIVLSYVVVGGIPGAIGGAIGGMIHRPKEEPSGRPAA